MNLNKKKKFIYCLFLAIFYYYNFIDSVFWIRLCDALLSSVSLKTHSLQKNVYHLSLKQKYWIVKCPKYISFSYALLFQHCRFTIMVYTLNSIWVLQTSNPGQNLILSCFRTFWPDFDSKMKINESKLYSVVLFPNASLKINVWLAP